MANFFDDNDDLRFQFDNVLLWDELARTSEMDYAMPGGHRSFGEAKAFYDEVIRLVGDLAANEIAPRAAAIDRAGAKLEGGRVTLPPELDAVVKKASDAGLFGMTIPRELGGSNCPLALSFVANELLARADVSAMTHIGFHGGMAMAMLFYSAYEGSVKIDENVEAGIFGSTRWDKEVREIVEGKHWGCMVLTEPDCGSDLGAIRTTAVEKNGKWLLNGTKIFITSGHGMYQFVLARSEETKGSGALDGLKGLSLFMVHRELEKDGKKIQNVKVEKVEHKLGHHGSATCTLVYEDSEGELIGKRGQGFELMLVMMNGARIAVGFEAIGMCEAAYRQAREYAALRRTMGKSIDQHELIAEMLLDMELDIRGLRAICFEAINCQELSTKYELLLKHRAPKDPAEAERLRLRAQKLKRRARELTPLLKYQGGEKAVEIARKNMQLHGGAGYMTEVGAEKLLRDALVVPVYEGTSQIQAIMALKDRLMAVLRDPTRFARKMSAASLKMTTAKSATERSLNASRLEVAKAITHLIGRVAGRKLRSEIGQALRDLKPQDLPRYLTQDFMRDWDMKVDFSYALLHAERLTRMSVDVEIGGVLWKQAQQWPERRALAQTYIKRMQARVRWLGDEIRSGDDSVFKWIEEHAHADVGDRGDAPHEKKTAKAQKVA